MYGSATAQYTAVRRPTVSAGADAMPITPLQATALAVLVIAALVVAALSVVLTPSAPSAEAWASVTIAPYTTLWDLATAHPIAGLDTATTVELIRAENALPSSTLQVGQTVLVPASVPADTALAQL